MPGRTFIALGIALLLFIPLDIDGQVSAQGPRERARGYVQVAEPVAPGVHVLRQAEPNFAGVIGNVTVIEQRDGLVLVDAAVSHGSGVRIVELLKSISPKPVKAVVITHWHGDHYLGLSAIVAAWPQADIIAHHQAAADIDSLMKAFPRAPSVEYETERIRSLGEVLAQLAAEQAVKAPTPEERAGWTAATVGNRDLRLADLAGTYLVLPRRTFTDTLTLPDPVTPIELRFLGRANTTGDILAWLPRQGVLIAGDVVVEPVPFMINVFPSDILLVLERMRAIPFQTLVPGHGVPLRGHTYLNQLTSLVRDALDQVGPLAREGVPLDQIAGRTDFSKQRTVFAGSDPWLAYWFERYTVAPLIESVYEEVRSKPPASAPGGP